VKIPKLGSITLPKRKRITDVLEQLSVRERPLRDGHCHDRKKVISLIPFVNLISDCNVLKGSYECNFYLLCTIVPNDELDIDALDGFVKGMHELHQNLEGEDPECFYDDTYKMEVPGDYKTLCQRF
jgi:hypothetical protein